MKKSGALVDVTSSEAKARMQHGFCEHLLTSDWIHVLMIHFAVDAAELQTDVPFELDLWNGTAFVSLVAFTMRDLQFAAAAAGKLFSCLLRPIATHHFLNVRTYVRCQNDVGIHFLAEWVSNRLAATLGPRTFSLPYRFGTFQYRNNWRASPVLAGHVEDSRTGAVCRYEAELRNEKGFVRCNSGSLDQWLMERYAAFNEAHRVKRMFRVWHEPWGQCKAGARLVNSSMLDQTWSWFPRAELVGANYSPGVEGVWLGRPHRI